MLLLLVSVAGISTVMGALMGGLTFGLFPKIERVLPKAIARNFTYLGAGLAALGIRRNPNGWTSDPGMSVIGSLVRRVLLMNDRFGGDVIDVRAGDAPSAAQEEVRELAGTAS